jgi:plasmid stabilization system protein ParE
LDVERTIIAQVMHIAEDSIDRALEWEDRLRFAIREIGLFPNQCAVDEEASRRYGDEVRKLVFERTYLIFYSVNEPARGIDVLHFRHGAQLPPP